MYVLLKADWYIISLWIAEMCKNKHIMTYFGHFYILSGTKQKN